MKRILVAHHAYFPGDMAHNRAVAVMLEAIHELGYEIDCILPRCSARSKPWSLEAHLAEKYRIRVKLKEHSAPVLPFVHRHASGFKKLYDFLALRANSFFFTLAVLLSGELYRVDVIYSRHTLLTFILSFLPKLNQRLVTEIHDVPESSWEQFKLGRLLRGKARVGVISRGIASRLGRMISGSHEKLVSVPDAVPTSFIRGMLDRTEARKVLGITEAGTVITYCGSLHSQCAPEDIADAMALVCGHQKVGWIVGGFPEQVNHMKSRAGNLDGRIRYWGLRPHYEIPYFLSASDILVVSYAAWHMRQAEMSSPLKIFEYIAARRPIVAPALPSVKEILTDRKSALLYIPGDPRSLAACIEELTDNRELGVQLANQAFSEFGAWTWVERARRLFGEV
ncbi:MAG: glycosyltransferase [Syntrophobacteraceae bacterium]